MPSQLVAYSGFSATNYLQEPYSADLDFGTGEWSVSAVVNYSAGAPGNIITYSNQLDNAAWNKLSGDTVSANVEGSADRITPSTTLGVHGVFQNAAGFTRQLISCEVKADGYNKVSLGESAQTGNHATFNLTTGTANSPALSRIEALADGWFRISYKPFDFSSIASGNWNIRVLPDNSIPSDNPNTYAWSGDGVKGVLVRNMMVSSKAGSAGTTAPDPYIETTATAFRPIAPIADRSSSSGTAITLGIDYEGRLVVTAFDGTTTRTVTTTAAYNTGTWIKPEANYVAGKLSIRVNGFEVASVNGAPLLSLNSRYNLAPDSETFENWSKQGTNTVTGINSVVAPDGTMTADVANLSVGQGKIFTAAIGAVIGKPHVFSIYMKGTAGQTLTVGDDGTGVNTAQTLTGGWDRFFITGNQTQTAPNLTFSLQAGQTATTLAVWGAQYEVGSTPTTYQRTGIRANVNSDFAFQAPLTIGNSFALNAPFPGSITMLKLGATVPTAEQGVWMYEQEKQMFRDTAQITLPSSTAVLDLAYDEDLDRFVAVQSGFESSFTGLVRTSSAAVVAGTFNKATVGAGGVKLMTRATTVPGVDVSIPAYGLREEVFRNVERNAKQNKPPVPFDFDAASFTATTTSGSNQLTAVASVVGTTYIGMGITGTGIPAATTIIGINGTTYTISANATATATLVAMGQNTFTLPAGYTAKEVISATVSQREGSTKNYVRLFDGFRETVRLSVAPSSAAWVQIIALKE
jgi:hypothetical protein